MSSSPRIPISSSIPLHSISDLQAIRNPPSASMGLLNLPPPSTAWRLPDVITAFAVVLLFFLLVFTPLGDSLASSGRQTLPCSDPQHRGRLVTAVDQGRQGAAIDACPADMVDHMPCEDPRINSQLSREMNYRERHCPRPDEVLPCLIPLPPGYRIPLKWPESLHKIWHANMPYDKIADRKGHQGG